MLLFKKIFIFFALSGLKSCLSAGIDTCALAFSKDFPETPPLILDNKNQEIVIPQIKGDFKGVIFNRGDKILLSCSGDDNNFEDNSVNGNIPSKILDCMGSDTLTANDKVYHFENLGCKHKRLANIRRLDDVCANGKASLWQIGYNVTASSVRSFWVPLITVCFDLKQSVTYYSSHTISGKGLLASQDLGHRPEFAVGFKELYPDFSPAQHYKQTEQLETLTQLLGSQQLAARILSRSYLSRGHLAPNADFFYKTTADATFFYINVAPQWEEINAGIWATLEEHIRNLAKTSQLDYNIHTGTLGILSLFDKDYEEQKLFLYIPKKELPIPQFYWKVVEEPKSKTGIAFVSHNKLSDEFKFDWPCESICEESAWVLDESEDEFICCNVNDLKVAIADFPDVNVNGILQGLDVSSAHNPKTIGIFSIFIIYLAVISLR